MGEAIPAYSRPLEGEFGRNVRIGIDHGFEGFFDLISGANDDEIDPVPHRRLGAIEFRSGRSLDALQALYRLAGRVAWHRLSATASAAGASAEDVGMLGEAMFAYVDRLCKYSVEGYDEAKSSASGNRGAARRRLFEMMIGGETDPQRLEIACREAEWRKPSNVSALALEIAQMKPLASKLGNDVLHGAILGVGCILIPDGEGPGRKEALSTALGGAPAALGPSTDVPNVSMSFDWARKTWELVTAGELTAESPLYVDAALAPLLLCTDRKLTDRIVDRRLAPLRDLRPATRERLAETLFCWLRLRGDRRAIATELHIHVQTVRYRMGQLRELFGSALDCPEARFELEIALRSTHLNRFASA